MLTLVQSIAELRNKEYLWMPKKLLILANGYDFICCDVL